MNFSIPKMPATQNLPAPPPSQNNDQQKNYILKLIQNFGSSVISDANLMVREIAVQDITDSIISRLNKTLIIGVAKKELGNAVYDPKQEQAVLNKSTDVAINKGMEINGVLTVTESIMQASKAMQSAYLTEREEKNEPSPFTSTAQAEESLLRNRTELQGMTNAMWNNIVSTLKNGRFDAKDEEVCNGYLDTKYLPPANRTNICAALRELKLV